MLLVKILYYIFPNGRCWLDFTVPAENVISLMLVISVLGSVTWWCYDAFSSWPSWPTFVWL